MYGPWNDERTWLLLMVGLCGPEKLEKRRNIAESRRFVPLHFAQCSPCTSHDSDGPARPRWTGCPPPRRGCGVQPHARRVSSSRGIDYCVWGRYVRRLRGEVEGIGPSIIREHIADNEEHDEDPDDRVNAVSVRWVGGRKSSYVRSPAVTVHQPPLPASTSYERTLGVRKRRSFEQHARSRAVAVHQPDLATKCAGGIWKRSEGPFPRVITLTLFVHVEAHANVGHTHVETPRLYPPAEPDGGGESRGRGTTISGGDLVERGGGSKSKGAGGGVVLVNMSSPACIGKPASPPAWHSTKPQIRDRGGSRPDSGHEYGAMMIDDTEGTGNPSVHERECVPPARDLVPPSITRPPGKAADVGTPLGGLHLSLGDRVLVIMKPYTNPNERTSR